MSRSVLVRVFGEGGQPRPYERVSLDIHQFAAGGMKTKETDSNGVAHFSLDVDQFAEITVYVAGQERVGRGPINEEYRIGI